METSSPLSKWFLAPFVVRYVNDATWIELSELADVLTSRIVRCQEHQSPECLGVRFQRFEMVIELHSIERR